MSCKLFDKEKINHGRQYEIDLLRGFTILILVFSHVALYLSIDKNSFLYIFSDIIASEPAAPVFMMLMGISIIFSKKQNALHLLKRGILLLVGGYLLNLIRSFPYWFMTNNDFFASIPGFFIVDIFQFAGLSFIFLALFKALKIPSWGNLIISFVFLIIGQIIMDIPAIVDIPENLTYFLNLFLPLNNEYCCFNFLTWFIYPCFGLVLGELIIRCKDKNKFYLILLLIGLIGVVTLYLNLGLRFPDYVNYYYGGNFYRMGIFNSLITLLVCLFLLSLWYFIGKILPNILQKPLSFLSKNITTFYVFSWVIISVIIHFQAELNIYFSSIELIGIMIFVLILCSLLVYLYNYLKRKIIK